MAKIGNLEFKIGEKYPSKYGLFYTQKYKFEIRGIDPEFFELTNTNSYGYQTEADLKQAIWKAIPVYHKLKEKQRLVIGYRARATFSLTMNKVGPGSYLGRKEGCSKKIMSFEAFSAPKLAFGIDYFVCMEIFNGKENEYFRVGEDHKVNSSNRLPYPTTEGLTFIDYNAENWAFFENIKRGMVELIKKMSTFFDLDSDQALLMIQQTPLLLTK